MTSMSSLEKPAIMAFFQQYENEDFQYDSMMPASQQFKKLSQEMDHEEGKVFKAKFGKALAKQFSQSFGDDLDSLDSWQALCGAVKIDPVPDTLEEAQIHPLGLCSVHPKAFERTHVNLIELVDAGYNSELPIKLFPTVRELSRYTLKNDLIFPRRWAKDGGLLCHLLRNIHNPERDDNCERRGWRGAAGQRRGMHAVRGRRVSTRQ